MRRSPAILRFSIDFMEVNEQGRVRLAERQQLRFSELQRVLQCSNGRSVLRNIGFHEFSPAVRKFRERYLKVEPFISDKSTYAQGELFTGRSPTRLPISGWISAVAPRAECLS